MRLICKALTLVFLTCLMLTLGLPGATGAPLLTPTTWQQGATGLKVSSTSANKTAGLTLAVKNGTTPFVYLQGGIAPSGYGPFTGPAGVELGEIKTPGTTSTTLATETTDWAHDDMTFATNLGTQIEIMVSRLSPAALISSQANALRLFSGNLNGTNTGGTNWSVRGAAPSYPKYVAYSSGGTVQIRSLSSAITSLPALDNHWILLWYGTNSHFADTKLPMSYSTYNVAYNQWLYPQSGAYQADVPVLLVFQNGPTGVQQSPQGGVDLSFAGAQGYVTVLPLLGRLHPRSVDTETWAQALPADIVSKIGFWTNRLCSYPTTVSESYAYDSGLDRATITENLTFLTTCSGGAPFAMLPPALALARDSLGVTFSGTVVDGQLPTEFGPTLGIDNALTYNWQVPGLKRYTDSRRALVNTGSVPADIDQELASQVQKIISGGHFLPWMFGDKTPRNDNQGNIYFLNPGDVIYHLTEIADAVTDPVLKSNLIQYIKTERASYPPETVYNLPNTGTLRGPFGLNDYATFQSRRADLFLKKVPLYNFYALARYYETTQEAVPSSVMTAANAALDQEMAQRDWASFGWFKGYGQRHAAVVDASRHLAGLVGFVKLARSVGDAQSEGLGRALLAKAAVLRLGMAKYPRYLYTAGLIQLPTDPAWQPKYTASGWAGFVFNYNWAGPYDDAQQVAMLDQFGTYLYDHAGYMTPGTGYSDWWFAVNPDLDAYQDVVPEAFRMLSDSAKADAEVAANKFTAFSPQWYVPFAEGVLGYEHGLSHPIDSFQVFMAKDFIQNETPDNLARYAGFAWVESGDLFYVHKLAEVVRAYKGVTWQ